MTSALRDTKTKILFVKKKLQAHRELQCGAANPGKLTRSLPRTWITASLYRLHVEAFSMARFKSCSSLRLYFSLSSNTSQTSGPGASMAGEKAHAQYIFLSDSQLNNLRRISIVNTVWALSVHLYSLIYYGTHRHWPVRTSCDVLV